MKLFQGFEKTITHRVYADCDAVAHAASERILEAAREAIASRGRFNIVLAGGSTPERTYRLLSEADADWQYWHIYFGDERCLPADDAERNSRMARDAWLAHVHIPAGQIYPIAAEQGAESAASEYRVLLEGVLPFDMVLLGMGEDGHTASLFPGHKHDPQAVAVPVYDAPKPPPSRVSLSAHTLSQTHALLFLVTGANKLEALKRWSRGEELPVASLDPQCPIELLLDSAAVGE